MMLDNPHRFTRRSGSDQGLAVAGVGRTPEAHPHGCMLVTTMGGVAMWQMVARTALALSVAVPCSAHGGGILLPITRPKSPRSDIYRLSSLHDGVVFDMAADGSSELTAWTVEDPAVGFLALDLNGNGQIDDCKELVGCEGSSGRRNGFVRLSQLGRGQGPSAAWVDEQNAIYEKLLIWVDRNHDGMSQAKELEKFSRYYTRIMFGSMACDAVDQHGNKFVLKGFAELRTAPGSNKPRSNREHDDRLIEIYEVILSGK